MVAGAAFALLGGANTRALAAGTATPSPTALPAVLAPDKVIAEATVVPVRSAALSFALDGTVADLLVNEGDRVEAGQVLARLDDRQQAGAVTQAEAEVRQAQAQLDELKAGARPEQIQAAQAALDGAMAQEELAKAGSGENSREAAIANAGVQRATAELALLQAGARPETIAGAEADVALASAALEQARLAQAQTELRAPFAGTIASLDFTLGQNVAAGAPLVQLADLTAWRIETGNLSELQVVHIRDGAAATITLDALPGVELSGRVTHVRALGEAKQGDITYTVVVEPNTEQAQLRWNMTAVVTIDY
jgi:HlyD family secretion protein